MLEENFICCGMLSTFGGAVVLLLNFCVALVEINMWFLIVVPPIPSNIVGLTAFLLSWMDLDPHGYLSFGCGTPSC